MSGYFTSTTIATAPMMDYQRSTMSMYVEEVRCRYPSKRCDNYRAIKRNGDLHRFCEFHRALANRNQRRLDQRRRQRKEFKGEYIHQAAAGDLAKQQGQVVPQAYLPGGYVFDVSMPATRPESKIPIQPAYATNEPAIHEAVNEMTTNSPMRCSSLDEIDVLDLLAGDFCNDISFDFTV